MLGVGVRVLLLSVAICFATSTATSAQYSGTAGRVVLRHRQQTKKVQEPPAAASEQQTDATEAGTESTESKTTEPQTNTAETPTANDGSNASVPTGMTQGSMMDMMLPAYGEQIEPLFGGPRYGTGMPPTSMRGGMPGYTSAPIGGPMQFQGMPALNQLMDRVYPHGMINMSFLDEGD